MFFYSNDYIYIYEYDNNTHKNILWNANIFQKSFKWSPNFIKYLYIYWIWIDCTISISYEESFIHVISQKNIWIIFFNHISINVWKNKKTCWKIIHIWKINIIVLEIIVSKIPFCVSHNVAWNERKNVEFFCFLAQVDPHNVLSPSKKVIFKFVQIRNNCISFMIILMMRNFHKLANLWTNNYILEFKKKSLYPFNLST
jgi:hypothetical protein